MELRVALSRNLDVQNGRNSCEVTIILVRRTSLVAATRARCPLVLLALLCTPHVRAVQRQPHPVYRTASWTPCRTRRPLPGADGGGARPPQQRPDGVRAAAAAVGGGGGGAHGGQGGGGRQRPAVGHGAACGDGGVQGGSAWVLGASWWVGPSWATGPPAVMAASRVGCGGRCRCRRRVESRELRVATEAFRMDR